MKPVHRANDAWYPLLIGILSLLLMPPCAALELTPRQWNHLPVNANLGGVAYAYTEADIFTDPALQLEDVKLQLDTFAVKYIRTFALLGRTARVDLTQAHQHGDWEGLLGGAPAQTSRDGLSDTFVRLAVNLYGAPALSGRDYMAYRSTNASETIVGAGLVVRLPTGDYHEDKLLNLGQNRYTFRPQLGAIRSWGKWTAEITGEAAFSTDNDEFFNGKTLREAPQYFAHTHLVYTFRPGLWAVASFGYDNGARHHIDGVDKRDGREDIGWGVGLAYPINRYSGIKLDYIGTRTQKSVGFDSDTFSANVAITW